ncbi:MAG: DNA gyrase subunit A, partial [Myxococcota bacterium]
ERRAVVEKIADVIRSKKLPAVQDVRDESTEECRIVCELKKDTEFDLVMAYLYKHTPLATNVSVNLTCLVPTDNPEISAPERVSLFRTLRHFLDFRMEVVTKRLQFDLQKLEERIHILEGLVVIFEFLDEAIRIIRKSDGKKDAAQKLMRRFELDELQVEAILELRLYKLAKLEILLIREELQDKEKQARKIRALLKSDSGRWKLIRSELNELKAEFARPRRTKIVANVQEPDYDAQAYIVDEDAMVLISVQGWLKRQQRIRDLATTRVREGDRVMEVVAGSTKSSVALFSSAGICYVQRLVDIPQTSGYGVPVQTLLKMGDGERIVAMTSFDARFLNVPEPSDETQEPEEPLALVVTALGKSLRFSLRNHREPSTKSGRRFCRLKSGDEVIYCGVSQPGTTVAVATAGGRALLCSIDEVAVLGGPGQGVTLIRLQDEDRVVAARLLAARDDALVVKRLNGSDYPISKRKYETVSRGGKGHALFKRGSVERPVEAEVVLPEFPAEEN